MPDQAFRPPASSRRRLMVAAAPPSAPSWPLAGPQGAARRPEVPPLPWKWRPLCDRPFAVASQTAEREAALSPPAWALRATVQSVSRRFASSCPALSAPSPHPHGLPPLSPTSPTRWTGRAGRPARWDTPPPAFGGCPTRLCRPFPVGAEPGTPSSRRTACSRATCGRPPLPELASRAPNWMNDVRHAVRCALTYALWGIGIDLKSKPDHRLAHSRIRQQVSRAVSGIIKAFWRLQAASVRSPIPRST